MSTLYYQGESKFFVAVDCILIGFDNRELHVLLYKRSFEPLKGSWSLMGGFVREGESVSQAANRVLTDCSGVDNLFMEQVGVYGEITRDLGERVISAAYYALVNMASIDVDTLKAHDAVGFNLLPEKFTLPQLQTLYEAIYQAPLDKRNFRKKINSMDILEKLEEKDKSSSKRGAFYYTFNKEKYDDLQHKGVCFSL